MNRTKLYTGLYTQLYPRLFILIFIAGLTQGCKKFIEIGAPKNTVPTETVFSDSSSAATGMLGVYSKMMGFYVLPNFASGTITLCAGQSADEFKSYSSSDQDFYNNALNSENSTVGGLWSTGYGFIYQTNLMVEGVEKSSGLSPTAKSLFKAEAVFVRSFCYFYLTNLFGDIPYVTSSKWNTSYGHGRQAQALIYQHLVTDLQYAAQHLPDSFPGTGRVRPIKLAAKALLARVYLYQKDWVNAEKLATEVIGDPIFASGLPTLSNAFLKNNIGAIWQLAPNVPNYNTPEGYQLVSGGIPTFYLDSSLLADFEPGDARFTNWVDSVTYKNVVYYYPYKYKVRTGPVISENYTMLRLAETILIRAEARNQQNKTAQAVSDMNIIRGRAELPALSEQMSSQQCTIAIAQERRIELFSEWGHRWLDLKRTGKAKEVLSLIKPLWTKGSALYPIPLMDLKKDPTLTQNEGYE